jgi:hypothetical protein
MPFQTKYSKKKWENIDARKIFLKHFSNTPADKGRIGRMLSAPTDAWNPASGGYGIRPYAERMEPRAGNAGRKKRAAAYLRQPVHPLFSYHP